MELRLLYYFVTLVREQSITKAAEKLFLTQPTLSRQLKSLEQYLGSELFKRGTRKISLTEAGLILYRRAEKILAMIEETETEIIGGVEKIAGKLRIGVLESTASQAFVAQVLAEMSGRFPDVSLEIFIGNNHSIQEQIQNGDLDLGLFIDPVDLDQFDYFHFPLAETWGVVVPKTSPLAQLERVTRADLQDCIALFHPRRLFFRCELNSWFKNSFKQIRLLGVYNLLSNVLSLVEMGVGGVITLEGSLFNYNTDNLKFIPLQPLVQSRILLGWKKQRIPTPVTAKFLQLLQQRIAWYEATQNLGLALPLARDAQGRVRMVAPADLEQEHAPAERDDP